MCLGPMFSDVKGAEAALELSNDAGCSPAGLEGNPGESSSVIVKLSRMRRRQRRIVCCAAGEKKS